jgi:hypothetical protein
MNFILDAAGSVKAARAMVIQQVQQIKITTGNYREVQELLGICERLERLQADLEVKSTRFAEADNGKTAMRTASSPRHA